MGTIWLWLLSGGFMFLPAILHAQVLVSGIVRDRQSGEPLAFVSVQETGTQNGTQTDSSGYYRIYTTTSAGSLQFSFTGYETRLMPFDSSGTIEVLLRTDAQHLTEVVVRAEGKKYRNKDNPAVALIRQVIAHKEENRISSYDFANYQTYEKLVIALENPGPEIRDNPLLQKYRFALNNLDTTTVPGKALLHIFIEENLAHNYYRRKPEGRKKIIQATKRIAMDGRFVNNESMGIVFRYIYQDIDIYDNNIYVLTNSFLSPIASLSPTFYKFFITDTFESQGQQIVRLSFVPRNTHDLLFYGNLQIVLNGRYSIQRAELSLSRHANINWINSLEADLDFEEDNSGKYYLKKTRMAVEFGLGFVNRGLYGERSLINSHFDIRTPLEDSIFRGPVVEKVADSPEQPDAFWQAGRPDPLTPEEERTYRNMDSLNNMRSFNRLVNWASFLFSGYKYLGPVEIGPWGSFYSFNPVEGLKLRAGGRTTTEFSKRYYLAGNLSYGFKDRRWKYFVSGSYSLNNKSIYGYPKHYIQVSMLRDTRIPGRGFQDENNILLSIKRGVNDKYLYNDVFRMTYVNQLVPNLRFQLDYENWRQRSAGGLHFQYGDLGMDTLKGLTISSLGLGVRWAPQELFLVRKDGLSGIPGPYPVITANIKTGIRGLQEGQYDFQQYELKIEKRFYLSTLGFADVVAGGGYLAGKLPYPLLFIPRANQTYNFQPFSYNLMNFAEFVSDHYVELKADYHMRGFLFNKVPAFRNLRLQEVASFKAIYGGLRRENNPEHDPTLLLFPVNNRGETTTFSLEQEPYMEFSVGIENILNVLRIDYVRRISYLDHPDISPWGIRFALLLAF